MLKVIHVGIHEGIGGIYYRKSDIEAYLSQYKKYAQIENLENNCQNELCRLMKIPE